MKHFVVYVPGLGDDRATGQQVGVSIWRIYGVTPTVFRFHWAHKTSFAARFDQLLALIDRKSQAGWRVSLVGTSAGGSAVVNAFAARPEVVRKVVLIAGEVNGRDTISPRTYRQNPVFKESMGLVDDSLASLSLRQRRRIMSVRGIYDATVPAVDSIIKDAHNRVVWTNNHSATIAWQILAGAPRLTDFIKS